MTYFERFRAQFGRAHKISRAQFHGLLLNLDERGLDLRGHAGWYSVTEDASLDDIALAVANAVHGITLVSLGGRVFVRLDRPKPFPPPAS